MQAPPRSQAAPREAALARAGGGRFRGVRYSAAWEADNVIGSIQNVPGPHLYRGAALREGLRRLTKLDFSLDASVIHPPAR